MKRLWLWMVTLTLGATMARHSHAQLALSAGETFVHRYENVQPTVGQVIGQIDYGVEVWFSFAKNTVQPGDSARIEVFEGDTSEVPICTTLVTNSTGNSFTNVMAFRCFARNGWWDYKGTLRLTVTTGCVTVRDFWIVVRQPWHDVFGLQYYSSDFVIVVPPSGPRGPDYALSIQREGGKAQLTWPVSADCYVLQSSVAVTGASWVDVPANPSIEDGRFVVTVDVAGTRGFFRLVK